MAQSSLGGMHARATLDGTQFIRTLGGMTAGLHGFSRTLETGFVFGKTGRTFGPALARGIDAPIRGALPRIAESFSPLGGLMAFTVARGFARSLGGGFLGMAAGRALFTLPALGLLFGGVVAIKKTAGALLEVHDAQLKIGRSGAIKAAIDAGFDPTGSQLNRMIETGRKLDRIRDALHEVSVAFKQAGVSGLDFILQTGRGMGSLIQQLGTFAFDMAKLGAMGVGMIGPPRDARADIDAEIAELIKERDKLEESLWGPNVPAIERINARLKQLEFDRDKLSLPPEPKLTLPPDAEDRMKKADVPGFRKASEIVGQALPILRPIQQTADDTKAIRSLVQQAYNLMTRPGGGGLQLVA